MWRLLKMLGTTVHLSLSLSVSFFLSLSLSLPFGYFFSHLQSFLNVSTLLLKLSVHVAFSLVSFLLREEHHKTILFFCTSDIMNSCWTMGKGKWFELTGFELMR